MQKHKIIHHANGHRPSRFLVDLPVLAKTKKEEKKVNIKKIYERLFIFEILKGVFVLFKKLLFILSIFSFLGSVIYRLRIFFKSRRKEKKKRKKVVELADTEAASVSKTAFAEATDVSREEPFEQVIVKNLKIKKEKKRGFVRRSFSLLRPALSFAVIVSFLVLPFKAFLELSNVNALEGRVMGIAESAIGDAMIGGEAIKLMDFKTAEAHFKSAKSALLEAEAEISWFVGASNLVNQVLPQEKTLLAEQASFLIEAGMLGTDLATHVSHILGEITIAKEQSASEIFKRIDLYLGPIEDTNLALAKTLEKINPEIIPEEYRSIIEEAKNKGEFLTGGVSEFVSLFKIFRNVLGFDYDTRHLLVFQNNSELRATGGFIGSYALIDFHNAEIKALEVPSGGAYDTKAGLYEMLRSPEPLQLLKSRWYFWDANWWPDWETSASKLAWFLEKSNGPTVDGVISLTPTFVEKLLALSGPIKIEGDFNIEVNSENFYSTIQSIVEDRDLYPIEPDAEAEQASKPKEIIGDLFDAMLKQIPERLDQDMIIELAQLFVNSLTEKQILLYFTDADNQKAISQLDWAGEQKTSDQDYLMVVNTNIGGGKSDRKIADTYELESVIQADGSVENILKINRQHFSYKNEPLVGVRNVDWLRVYVPEGSVLLEADGFVAPDKSFFKTPAEFLKNDPYVAKTEALATTHVSGAKIYNENNKTVFAGWLMLDPGESKTVVFRYRLPLKVSESNGYELLVQKQPGTVNASLYYTLHPSLGMELQSNSETVFSNKNPFGFRGNLDVDRDIQLRIKN